MVKYNKPTEKNEDLDDEFDSDIGDDEIDEELALPSVLSGITYDEKRELLRFKHDHNEIDWEKEILRRSDLLARKIDMERLKRMSKGTNKNATIKDADIVTTGKGKPKRSSAVKQTGLKGKTQVSKPISDSDEYSEEEDGEIEDDEIAADDDDDDDDELFDSEEEEEISKRVLNESYEEEGGEEEDDDVMIGSKRKTTEQSIVLEKRRSTARSAAKKNSYDLDDEEDDDEYDSEEELYGKRISKSKDNNDEVVDYNLRLMKDKKTKVSNITKHSNDIHPSVPIAIDEDDLDDMDDGKEDDSPIAELEDYLRLQTKRDMIIKWLNEPYLKAAVIGTFVKYSIGAENNQTIYRMCQVVDIDLNSKPYKSEFIPGEQQITARLTITFAGNIRKYCRIDGVSNSRITEHELAYFLKCHAKSIKSNFKPFTINQIERQRQRILKSFKSHVYTTDEINNMVAKSSGLDKSLVTEFTTAMDSLQKRLARAREMKDYESLETIQKTIDRLQKQHNLQKEIFDRASKRQVIVNRKMKEGNTLRDMEAGMRKRQEDLEAAVSGKLPNSVTDPFIRRDTRPKILWNTGKRMESILQSKEKEEGKEDNKHVSKDTIQEIDMTNDGSKQINSSSDYNNDQLVNELSLVIKWKKVDEYALTLDQIRKRVKQRLGVDPYYEAKEITQRDRYLSRVCADLPPIDSEDRALLRGAGVTLKDFIVHTEIDTEMMQT